MILWERISFFLSLSLAVATLLTVALPSLRRKGKKLLRHWCGFDLLEKELSGVRTLLEQHVMTDRERRAETELQRQVDACILRDLITNIYYKHLKERTIPLYELEDLSSLHDLYRKRGGNSYVEHIFREMTEDWEIER